MASFTRVLRARYKNLGQLLKNKKPPRAMNCTAFLLPVIVDTRILCEMPADDMRDNATKPTSFRASYGREYTDGMKLE